MKWKAVVACVLTLLVPAAGFAQELNSKEVLDRVRTQSVDSRWLLEAAIQAARREGITAGSPQQRAEHSWRSRHPVGFGALVGAAAGSIVTPIVYSSTIAASDEEAGFAVVPTFAVIGAGIGAGVGALTSWIISIARR